MYSTLYPQNIQPGPNHSSMGDIWRMAWDQKSTKIVMLTKLVEEGKVQ